MQRRRWELAYINAAGQEMFGRRRQGRIPLRRPLDLQHTGVFRADFPQHFREYARA